MLSYHFGSLFSLTVLTPTQPVLDSKQHESGGDIPTVRQVPGAQQKLSKYLVSEQAWFCGLGVQMLHQWTYNIGSHQRVDLKKFSLQEKKINR